MQFLNSRFMGSLRETTPEPNTKHPIWERVAKAIRSSSDTENINSSPPGISSTIVEHLREFSTAVNNLWQGSIYTKSLDYLLRVILRLHLAPEREKKYKARVQAEAQRKLESSIKPKKMTRTLWKWKISAHCNELADALHSKDQGRDSSKRTQAILGALLRLKQVEPPVTERPPTSLEAQLQKLEQENGEAELPDPSYDDLDCDFDGDFDYDDYEEQLDSEVLNAESSSGNDGENGKMIHFKKSNYQPYFYTVLIDNVPKEPSRKRLRCIQAILKSLLESPSIHQDIDANWVKKTSFKGSDLTESECRLIAQLANTLRPYVPKRRRNPDGGGFIDPAPHVGLRAPLVMISNAVLRATGYVSFARKIAPQVSPSKLHGLALGGVGIFEALCKASEEQFDIKDAHGAPLTYYRDITSYPENKRFVFGAFFNLDRIESLCSSHGLKFCQRSVRFNVIYTTFCIAGDTDCEG